MPLNLARLQQRRGMLQANSGLIRAGHARYLELFQTVRNCLEEVIEIAQREDLPNAIRQTDDVGELLSECLEDLRQSVAALPDVTAEDPIQAICFQLETMAIWNADLQNGVALLVNTLHEIMHEQEAVAAAEQRVRDHTQALVGLILVPNNPQVIQPNDGEFGDQVLENLLALKENLALVPDELNNQASKSCIQICDVLIDSLYN